MFPMLHLLRKISNHLDLLRSDDTEAKLDARADERVRRRPFFAYLSIWRPFYDACLYVFYENAAAT